MVNVLTIKFFFELPLIIRASLCLSILLFSFFEGDCLKAAADIYEISREFGESIRKDKSKLVRTVGRSLRPLKIEVGKSYFFKMSTYTTFIQTVVDNTVNVLLTYKNT